MSLKSRGGRCGKQKAPAVKLVPTTKPKLGGFPCKHERRMGAEVTFRRPQMLVLHMASEAHTPYQITRAGSTLLTDATADPRIHLPSPRQHGSTRRNTGPTAKL